MTFWVFINFCSLIVTLFLMDAVHFLSSVENSTHAVQSVHDRCVGRHVPTSWLSFYIAGLCILHTYSITDLLTFVQCDLILFRLICTVIIRATAVLSEAGTVFFLSVCPSIYPSLSVSLHKNWKKNYTYWAKFDVRFSRYTLCSKKVTPKFKSL